MQDAIESSNSMQKEYVMLIGVREDELKMNNNFQNKLCHEIRQNLFYA